MKEKNISLNKEASQIWWFIAWRGAVAGIIINVLAALIQKAIPNDYGAIGWIAIILTVIASVYFVKLAINRDYKGFRLIAVER